MRLSSSIIAKKLFLAVLILIPTLAVCSMFAFSRRDISFDVIFAWPTCQHDGHRSSWCTIEDLDNSRSKQAIEKKLFADLHDDSVTDLFFAVTQFSSCDAANAICQQLGHNSRMTAVIDRMNEDISCLDTLLSSCTAKVGTPPTLMKLGSREPWNVQHIKVVVAENAKSPFATIIFGNGNFTEWAFNLSFNSWIKVRASRKSSIFKQHQCLIESLTRAASVSPQNAAESRAMFESELRACRRRLKTHSFEQALEHEKIAPLFAPMQDDEIRNKIIDTIDQVPPGGEILAASQFLASPMHAAALRRAARRKVSVRLILDDDYITGDIDPGLPNQVNKLLVESGVQVRYVETNPKGKQQMHMKFLILNGEKIIVGSGQFSQASFGGNYENLYFITESSVINQYRHAFHNLWDLAYQPSTILESIGIQRGIRSKAH